MFRFSQGVAGSEAVHCQRDCLPFDNAVKTSSEDGRLVLEACIQQRGLMGIAAAQVVMASIIKPS